MQMDEFRENSRRVHVWIQVSHETTYTKAGPPERAPGAPGGLQHEHTNAALGRRTVPQPDPSRRSTGTTGDKTKLNGRRDSLHFRPQEFNLETEATKLSRKTGKLFRK